MKKNLKIFAIAYLAFLFISVISCDTCDCGSSPNRFSITSFIDDIYSFELVDNTYYHRAQIENNEVNYDKFGIFVSAETENYYAKAFHFNLMNSAYACSCVEPTTNDKIINVEIITNTNFDATHLAGSDVTAYFTISPDTNNLQDTSIEDYFSLERNFSYSFLLLLKNAPLEEGEMDFTVKITLDGRTLDNFEFTTNTVTITND